MEHPFVYIASLRRTGSTVLAEALTRLPYSFIFPEPQLCRGRFKIREENAALFEEGHDDISAFQRRHGRSSWLSAIKARLTGTNPSLVDAFKRELLPRLTDCVMQIGVKEIHHEGWRNYTASFPDTRIVLTARDPRDIYIVVPEKFGRSV